MEINLGRDGIRNTDEVSALIYYGRYPVNSWAELYFAAVKTLYIEYPEVINKLVSKDSTRALYLRTTTIDMKKPVRIDTILYLDADRTPLEIVKALREIFRRAGVLNINMSIEIKRKSTVAEEIKIEDIKKNIDVPQIETPITPQPIPAHSFVSPSLEVPSFMRSDSESIRKLSCKEMYIEQMKNLVKRYPERMKKEVGKFLNNRRVTLAESSYRYFIEAVEIGEGLSIEVFFNEEDLKKNVQYYLKIAGK